MARFGPVEIRRQGAVETQPETFRRDLRSILAEHEVIEVDQETGVILVAQTTGARKFTSIDFDKEIGSSGVSYRREVGGEDYNRSLAGREGIKVYDKMRRSDSTVRQSLRIAKTPVLSGRWFVESADPSSEEANLQAKFIEKALFEWQSISWFQFMTEALLMLDYGYYTFEKVFTMREVQVGDRRMLKAIWKKFAPRHPYDIEEWEYDVHGGAQGAFFTNWSGAGADFIPISKLLVFTYDKEAGNVEGISLLRSAYKHWYYKDNLYKIDAIQKERHGIGIPIIKLPPGYTDTDKNLAKELGRNLRTNERAYVVLPPLWEIEFADIKGGVIDIGPSIEHHDNAIVRNVLANFVGTETSAAASVQVELFLKATRFIADIIADVINKYAIPELIDFNFVQPMYPRLSVRRIGETTDWRTMSFAIRNLIGAGVIRPDDPFEEWTRSEMDLPQADPKTAREVATPQGAPAAKPPRQGSPSAAQGQGTGEDRSGG